MSAYDDSILNTERGQKIIHIFLTNQAEGMPLPTSRDIMKLTDITSPSVVSYLCNELVKVNILEHISTPSSRKKKYVS